jgi:hypothetical protein
MTKKVNFKTKKSMEEAADKWVQSQVPIDAAAGESEGAPMKRLTIDVPQDLHKRIKTYCAANGLIMADEIRTLLDEKFPKS